MFSSGLPDRKRIIGPCLPICDSRDPVSIINYDAANAIKITIPRPAISGDINDTDVFGGQQHGPLVEIEVP